MLEISFNLHLRSIPEGVFDDLTDLEELIISIINIHQTYQMRYFIPLTNIT